MQKSLLLLAYFLLFAFVISADDWSSLNIVDAHAHIGTFRGFEIGLETLLQDMNTFGSKFHPELNHYDADDPRVDSYLKLCEKFQIPAVFHCGLPGSHSSPERIYVIAKRHPMVPIVLYHMVFFGPHQDAIAIAKQAI